LASYKQSQGVLPVAEVCFCSYGIFFHISHYGFIYY